MILTEEVQVKWHYSNKEHYINKGYIFTHYGDAFIVKVADLHPNGAQLVTVKCDYQMEGCKDIHQKRAYEYHRGNANSVIHTDCCSNPSCMKEKRKESLQATYGVDHMAHIQGVQELRNKTNIEKYGGKSPMCDSEVREKSVSTIQERYGVDHISQVNEVRQKALDTTIQRYGVSNPMQNEDIQLKARQTNLEKYGVEYVAQSSEVQEKIAATNLKRYGVSSVLCFKSVRDKGHKVLLKRYGSKYVLSLQKFRDKANQSLYQNQNAPCSSQQRYLCNLFNGQLNYLVDNVFLDIAFPDENLYIEYQGSGHNLRVKFGDMTEAQFLKKEINRGYFLSNQGWKRIEIISAKDYLPSDEVLLQMLDYAKQYISTGHSWIKFDVDTGKVLTSQYEKDYQYGELCKIKKITVA